MKKPKTPTPVITATLTLITIFFWAGFEVYRSFTTKQPPQIEEAIVRQLDPGLDIQSLNDISNRPVLEDAELGNNILRSPSPTPTTIPSSSPTATSSGTLEPSPIP